MQSRSFMQQKYLAIIVLCFTRISPAATVWYSHMTQVVVLFLSVDILLAVRVNKVYISYFTIITYNVDGNLVSSIIRNNNYCAIMYIKHTIILYLSIDIKVKTFFPTWKSYFTTLNTCTVQYAIHKSNSQFMYSLYTIVLYTIYYSVDLSIYAYLIQASQIEKLNSFKNRQKVFLLHLTETLWLEIPFSHFFLQLFNCHFSKIWRPTCFISGCTGSVVVSIWNGFLLRFTHIAFSQ